MALENKEACLFGLIVASLVVVTGCCSEEELPTFRKSLYSPSAKERNAAALGLARCGARASDMVPRLGQLLYDENVGVQSSSAYALRKIDTPDARVLLSRAEARRRK